MQNTTAETVVQLNIDHIAGLAIFFTSLIGMISNGIVVRWISRLPSMQNSFGSLSVNQSLADFLHACVFMFYFFPTVFFDIKPLKTMTVSRWFGHLQLIFYDACNASHFIVSINRAFAIFFPINYNKYFTIRLARMLNGFAWFIAIVPSIFAYYVADCKFYYNDAFWSYTFTTNPECLVVSWYYDFLKSIGTVVLIAVFDMVTFAKCRVHGASILKTITDDTARARTKDEINFVTQAFLQGVIFIMELITFFVFPPMVDSRLAKFALTTIAWISVHAIDGIIIIVFNKEFNRILRKYNQYTQAHSDNAWRTTTDQFSISGSRNHNQQQRQQQHRATSGAKDDGGLPPVRHRASNPQ